MVSALLRYVHRHHVGLLALFIALGGTAYAVSLPRNSVGTKQLKNRAVTGKKIRDNAIASRHVRRLTAKDFASGALLIGPAGSVGPQGPAGTPGRDLTYTDSLASGQTLTGIFAGGGGNTSELIQIQIEFRPRLPSDLDFIHVVRVPKGMTAAAACPGQGQADRGYFCLYEVDSNNVTFNGIGNPVDNTLGVDRLGSNVAYNGAGTNANVYGTWAVTAP